MPSGILIHPANAPKDMGQKFRDGAVPLWGEGNLDANLTQMWPDRQDRQRSDSIGRTVLQCRLG